MKLLLLALITSSLAFAANIDLKKSHVQWTGSKITGSEHTGKISFKSGEVSLDDNKITTGKFVVDINTFSVEDISGETAKKFVGHMVSADFFEVSKYPTASLKITKVKGNTITAMLTMKDKSAPVTFNYKLTDKVMSGKFEINRTKFNMIYGSKNFFKNLGDKVINDKVQLSFNIVIK